MRAILYGENIVSRGKTLKFNYHLQRKKMSVPVIRATGIETIVLTVSTLYNDL